MKLTSICWLMRLQGKAQLAPSVPAAAKRETFHCAVKPLVVMSCLAGR